MIEARETSRLPADCGAQWIMHPLRAVVFL
jgi:hypothetical protein